MLMLCVTDLGILF